MCPARLVTLALLMAIVPTASGSSSRRNALAPLRACIQQSDARCATAALGKIGANERNDPEYLDLKAQTLLLERQPGKALSSIQRAIQLRPNQDRYFITQGRIDQSLGNQPAAIKSFLRAEQLHPGSETPVYYLGMSFFLLGNYYNDNSYYQRAAQHFRTALELNPRAAKSEFMLGVIDAVELKLDSARQHFETAEKLRPQNPYYHLYDGIVLGRMGDNADALREMNLAKQINPSDARTRLNLGELYSRMGRYKEARREMETTVKLDPRLSEAYYALGRVYERLGLASESREAFHKFQEMKSEPEQTDDSDLVEGAVAAQSSR